MRETRQSGTPCSRGTLTCHRLCCAIPLKRTPQSQQPPLDRQQLPTLYRPGSMQGEIAAPGGGCPSVLWHCSTTLPPHSSAEPQSRGGLQCQPAVLPAAGLRHPPDMGSASHHGGDLSHSGAAPPRMGQVVEPPAPGRHLHSSGPRHLVWAQRDCVTTSAGPVASRQAARSCACTAGPCHGDLGPCCPAPQNSATPHHPALRNILPESHSVGSPPVLPHLDPKPLLALPTPGKHGVGKWGG